MVCNSFHVLENLNTGMSHLCKIKFSMLMDLIYKTSSLCYLFRVSIKIKLSMLLVLISISVQSSPSVYLENIEFG